MCTMGLLNPGTLALEESDGAIIFCRHGRWARAWTDWRYCWFARCRVHWQLRDRCAHPTMIRPLIPCAGQNSTHIFTGLCKSSRRYMLPMYVGDSVFKGSECVTVSILISIFRSVLLYACACFAFAICASVNCSPKGAFRDRTICVSTCIIHIIPWEVFDDWMNVEDLDPLVFARYMIHWQRVVEVLTMQTCVLKWRSLVVMGFV